MATARNDSGGGGGGAVFELLYWTFQLCIYTPQIGLPIIAIIVVLIVMSARRQRLNKSWDSGPPVELHRAVDVEALRRIDPDFSQVVFEDFAFRLFSTAQRARSAAASLATVAPYVSQRARDELASRPPSASQFRRR